MTSGGVRARVELDTAAVSRAFAQSGDVYLFVDRFLRKVATRAKLYAPVDTGYLRNSITTAMQTSGTRIYGSVGTSAEYAIYVHEGTAARTIRPRRPGGVLVFTVGGRKVFAKSVSHPGTPARPFLRRALTEEMAQYT